MLQIGSHILPRGKECAKTEPENHYNVTGITSVPHPLLVPVLFCYHLVVVFRKPLSGFVEKNVTKSYFMTKRSMPDIMIVRRGVQD
jgi:hypothetical protein